MRVRLLAPFALLLATSLVGCEKSPRDRLEGKWIGDGVAQVHATQAGRADEWAKQVQVEFKGSNVTIAIPAEEARSGTFKVTKTEGKDMDVVFKRKAGGEDRSRLTLLEDDKLRWTLANGIELLMHKE
ncbi:MAG: hypothetical protein HOW73_50675 [Polyangiaceae bacterium]|nr:hypothetical protein [Polyangiaceae bacterium]